LNYLLTKYAAGVVLLLLDIEVLVVSLVKAEYGLAVDDALFTIFWFAFTISTIKEIKEAMGHGTRNGSSR
jgi:hypothetical protein